MNLTEKPKTLFCYICGREFGTSSLGIHLKQCPKKFEIQQAKKEPKNRRKCPSAPEELSAILSGQYGSEIMETYNQKAINIHKYQSLAACRFCARTFNEESLKAHENGCSKRQKTGGPRLTGAASKSIGATQWKPPEQSLKKPRTLVCCVCGREFGLKSLKIHYPKCSEKLNNSENLKQKKERKPAPKFSEDQMELVNHKEDWTEEEIEEFNKHANANYRENGMTQCPNCKRKFLAEAFEKHKKNCVLINGEKDGGGMGKNKAEGYQIGEAFKKPRTLTCCVCGREFGLSSLKIHYPQCIQKFEFEQAKKPKGERKVSPTFSADQLDMINNKTHWAAEEIEEFNQHANGNYRDNAMTQCPNCKRKFFAEAYLKHKKNCVLINGDKGTPSVPKMPESDSEWKKPRVLMCHICGREFGLTSLTIHQKKCELKFTSEEKKKEREQRKALPVFPERERIKFDLDRAECWDHATIEEYNRIANQVYRSESLSACPICNRKFFQESLPKHLKHCQKNQEKANKDAGSRSSSKAVLRESSSIDHTSHRKSGPSKEKPNIKVVAQNKKISDCENEVIQEQDESALSSPEKQSFMRKSMKRRMEVCVDEGEDEDEGEGEGEDEGEDEDEGEGEDEGEDGIFCGKVEEVDPELEETVKNVGNSDGLRVGLHLDDDEEVMQGQQKSSLKNYQGNAEVQKKQPQPAQKQENTNSKKMEKSKQISDKAIQNGANGNLKLQPGIGKGKAVASKTQRQGKAEIKEEEDLEESATHQNQFSQLMPEMASQQEIQTDGRNPSQKIQQEEKKNADASLSLKGSKNPKARSSRGFAAPRKKEEAMKQNMKECRVCARKIAEDRIEKHEQICQKSREKHEKIKENNIRSSIKKIQGPSSEASESAIEPTNDQEGEQSSNEFMRDSMTPEEQIRMKKGFAAPRQKQQEMEKKMVECRGCTRKYADDRIEKHQKVCKKAQEASDQAKRPSATEIPSRAEMQEDEAADEEKKSLIRVACQFCKRKFAQQRLQKHQQICKDKQIRSGKIIEEPKRTKKDASQSKDVEKMEGEKEAGQALTLEQCEKCERKFNAERILKHMEVCKGTKKVADARNSMAADSKKKMEEDKKMGYNLDKLQEQGNGVGCKEEQDRVECPQCKRKFIAERLEKHQAICKVKPFDERDLKNQVGSKMAKKTTAVSSIKKGAPLPAHNSHEVNPVKENKMSHPQSQGARSGTGKAQGQMSKQKSPKLEPITPSTRNKKQGHGTAYDDYPRAGEDQFVEEDLEECQKCLRKFKADRLSKHMQICKGSKKLTRIAGNSKGPPQTSGRLPQVCENRQENANKPSAGPKLEVQEQQLRKTKTEFFNMVKDLKSQKIGEDDIDKKLEHELDQIQKTSGIARKREDEIPEMHSKLQTPRKLSKKKGSPMSEKPVVLPKI